MLERATEGFRLEVHAQAGVPPHCAVNLQGAVESFPLSGGDSQAEGGGNGARKSSGKDVLRILGALCCLRGKVYAVSTPLSLALPWSPAPGSE